MNVIQPISGVIYLVQMGKPDSAIPSSKHLIYAPWRDRDPEPWQDEDGDRFAWKDHWVILWIDFNPHPPTRTEWVLGNSMWREEETFTDLSQAQCRLADFEESYPGKFALFSRQVSEWQEITESA